MKRGPLPTSIFRRSKRETGSMRLTVLDPRLAESRVEPSGVSASATGSSPGVSLIRSVIRPARTSMTSTPSSPARATYTFRPRWSRARPAGPRPVAITSKTCADRLSNTLTSFERLFATKPIRPGAGRSGG